MKACNLNDEKTIDVFKSMTQAKTGKNKVKDQEFNEK